jgi:predicted Zn-dependent protease
MYEQLQTAFKAALPAVDFAALRLVDERAQVLTVRQGVAAPPSESIDRGVMVSVIDQGGMGYAATSDLTESGLREALARARDLAVATRAHSVVDYKTVAMASPVGRYAPPPSAPMEALTLADRYALLADVAAATKCDDRIVDWESMLWTTHSRQLYLTSEGGAAAQEFHFVVPNVSATAHAAGITQSRSSAGRYNGYCQQGGREVLERAGFAQDGERVAQEALALVMAPDCPGGVMDVVLMPDQMMLQIHESIGHPLELDRILGDERNFAGTSFVTLDMFGTYQYGSELLNVTYDPTRAEQFASFAYDDDGTPAKREFIIENGILKRPLGSAISQARAGMPGVANARACSWNRPPIDRMANLNIEPGTASLNDLIGGIEFGVLMKTNLSWSIDDSRNKFQFGCEYGQVIRRGKLAEVVRNPNYRGVSATFWRSLAGVGDASTMAVMGTPYCGKGEPSQVIRVGHASPACHFANIDVFGGA